MFGPARYLCSVSPPASTSTHTGRCTLPRILQREHVSIIVESTLLHRVCAVEGWNYAVTNNSKNGFPSAGLVMTLTPANVLKCQATVLGRERIKLLNHITADMVLYTTVPLE